MARGNSRIAIAGVAFLVLTVGASPQFRAKPRAGTLQSGGETRGGVAQINTISGQPTNPNVQRRSLTTAMKTAVNPTNRDYGLIFNGWQDTVVRYTIENSIWWFSVVSLLCLIAGAVYFWWYTEMWAARQACFERSAAVLIGQRNTAVAHAVEVTKKHNALVDRLDRLQEEYGSSDQQADSVLGGELATDQALAPSRDDSSSTPDGSAVVVLEGIESVEKQVIPGEAAAIYKIGDEEFVKKEDAARQLAAEKQRSSRLSAKVRQQQDQLFQYEK